MSQEERERLFGGYGSAFLLISGLCLGLAIPYATETGPWFVIFVLIGLGFLIPGLHYAGRPIRGINERITRMGIRIDNIERSQQEITANIRDMRIENLQLHLSALRLSFDTNKKQIAKNMSLQNYYSNLISKVESNITNIETL